MRTIRLFLMQIVLFTWSILGCGDNHHEFKTVLPERGSETTTFRSEELIPDLSPGINGKIAYDQHRNRIVFIGFDPFQTWEWIDKRWLQIATNHSLPSFFWFEMVYFPPLNKTIVIGLDVYYEEHPNLFQMWGYDGLDWQRIEADLIPPEPNGRLTYDPLQQRLLYTGGGDVTYGYPHYVKDIWAYNGYYWQKLPEPGEISHHFLNLALGFDASRDRLVLTGSYHTGCSSSVSQTWEYDGEQWSIINSSEGPIGSMVYDSQTEKLYVVCEAYMSGGLYGTEIYQYDEGHWIKIDVNPEIAVAAGSAVFNSQEGVIYTYRMPCTMTYTPDQGWTDKRPQNVPGNQSLGLAAYYPKLSSTVMLLMNHCDSNNLETWLWDGSHFRTAASPPITGLTYSKAMTYDPILQRILLFSFTGGTRTWEFRGKHWSELDIPEPKPKGFYKIIALFFPKRNSIIFWGKSLYPEYDYQTLEFRDNRWHVFNTQPIPKTENAQMAYDASTDRIILFGGQKKYICLNETWAFDGQDWQRINTIDAPSFRYSPIMIYDKQIGKIVLTGGNCGLDTFGDLWEFSDNNWFEKQITGPKPARYDAAFAYDLSRNRLIICGGKNSSSIHGSLLEIYAQHK